MTHFDKMHRTLAHQAPQPLQMQEEEVDVFALFRIVRRRIGLILAVGALITAASMPLILSIERPYYAQTRILIEAPLSASLAQSNGAVEPATEVQRLLARDVAVKLIRDLDLQSRPEFNPALRTPSLIGGLIDRARLWLRGASPTQPGGNWAQSDPMDAVLASYYAALGIGQSAGSNVIDIGFRSLDPGLAAAVPNAIVRIYRAERAAQVAREVEVALEWIDQRIAAQRQRLSVAQAAVQAFRDTNAGEAGAEGRAELARGVADIGARLASNAAERAELNSTLAAIEQSRRDGTDLPPIELAGDGRPAP